MTPAPVSMLCLAARPDRGATRPSTRTMSGLSGSKGEGRTYKCLQARQSRCPSQPWLCHVLARSYLRSCTDHSRQQMRFLLLGHALWVRGAGLGGTALQHMQLGQLDVMSWRVVLALPCYSLGIVLLFWILASPLQYIARQVTAVLPAIEAALGLGSTSFVLL
jgi:hypothetical protein